MQRESVCQKQRENNGTLTEISRDEGHRGHLTHAGSTQVPGRFLVHLSSGAAVFSVPADFRQFVQGPVCIAVRKQHLEYTFLNLVCICLWTFVRASLQSHCYPFTFSWHVRCFPICLLWSRNACFP